MTSSPSDAAGAAAMSTTTLEETVAAPAPAAEPPRRVRRRGERGPLGAALLHGGLAVASLVALAPVAWLCYLSLGPDKDDYLHPGRIAGKLSFSNYSFVLQHTGFFDWFKSTMIVAVGTTLIGVLVAATTGYAVSRMRFPGYKQLMWVLLLTQAFPISSTPTGR
jgi:arabinogalactan oligomer/maltooligosaccharide transport system permease protein